MHTASSPGNGQRSLLFPSEGASALATGRCAFRCRRLVGMVLAWIALAAICGAAVAGPQYTVRQLPLHPGALEVTLQLPKPADDAADVKLAVRGAAWGLQEQVQLPRCGDVLLKKVDDNWLVPDGCQQVTWRVDAPVAQDGATDVSLQASVAFRKPDWILLAEPTSLLRPQDDAADHGVIRAADNETRLLGGAAIDDGAWLVPPQQKAPEFYVIGDASAQRREIGGFLIDYVADDPERISELGLVDKHAGILQYLSGILFPHQDIPEGKRTLLVVWIGMDAKHGHAGGAAGYRSFVTNYVIGPQTPSAGNNAVTFLILAHEQFHQLVEIKRADLPALPGWVNESLAQYYGVQSLLKVNHSETAQTIAARFIDKDIAVEKSLPEIEALFETDRPRALDLSYRQGATFWAELDQALQDVSQGQNSLSRILPDLMSLSFPSDGQLSAEIIGVLNPSRDARIDRIIKKYFHN